MASPAVTVLVVLAWYSSNIGVLILNKFLLSSTGFRFPVFLSLCHMMACAVLSLILHTTKLYPAKPIKSREQLLKIALLASIFCMTIVLGNASLRYLPVSFNQAVGSSTPFFTAFFSYSMQGIREARTTYATLIPIATGVVIASGGEPLFHLLGFIFCLTATAGRALKSVVQAMLMADPNEKMDPMSLLMYMASISVVILVPTSLLWEPQALKRAGELMAEKPGFVWWLLGNSTLAYFVNLTNFMVTKYTSALTLQVLGNAKGVVAALISLAIFKNPVTVKGAVGYAITVAGVILYSESKKRCKAMQEARSKGLLQHSSPQQPPQQQQESIPLLNVVTLDFGGKAKDSTA